MFGIVFLGGSIFLNKHFNCNFLVVVRARFEWGEGGALYWERINKSTFSVDNKVDLIYRAFWSGTEPCVNSTNYNVCPCKIWKLFGRIAIKLINQYFYFAFSSPISISTFSRWDQWNHSRMLTINISPECIFAIYELIAWAYIYNLVFPFSRSALHPRPHSWIYWNIYMGSQRRQSIYFDLADSLPHNWIIS